MITTDFPAFQHFMTLAKVAATVSEDVVSKDLNDDEYDEAIDKIEVERDEALRAIAGMTRYVQVTHDLHAELFASSGRLSPQSSTLTVGFDPDGWRLMTDFTDDTFVKDNYTWVLLVRNESLPLDVVTSSVITGALEPWLYAAIQA